MMMYMLVLCGVWDLLLSFFQWSLVSKNRLLKTLCILNGVYMVIIGIIDAFRTQELLLIISFILSLLTVGTLAGNKFHTEKNTLSTFSIIISAILTVLAGGIMLTADDASDFACGCVTLTGCIMILSMPYSALHDRMKKA